MAELPGLKKARENFPMPKLSYTREQLWWMFNRVLDEHTCCLIEYEGKVALMSEDAMDLFEALLGKLEAATAK